MPVSSYVVLLLSLIISSWPTIPLAQESSSVFPKEEVIRLVSTQHYLQPQAEELTQINDVNSLNAYLQKLDPYSKYLPPEQNEFYKKRHALQQVGIGINILIHGDRLLAVPVYQGPAYQAGLKLPRYLISLDRHKIIPDDFASFSFLTELSVGTKIPLQVFLEEELQRNQEENYTVTVNSFENHAIEYLNESGINLIRIHQFSATEGSLQLRSLVQRSLQRDKYLIIDLRYCPGGSLYEVIDAVSWFLPAELTVSYLKKARVDKLKTLTSLPGRIVNKQRIYLWVSPFTASSAEIFARILRYYANTVIIGTPTQGKCLSQQSFELEDGSVLQLSTFEVLGPDKQSCEGQSIQPDVEVKPNEILNTQNYFKLSRLEAPRRRN